jgi:DNA invertase Pin-like site-specific DNA recombinase
MNSHDREWPRATLPLVRCAVYTRKSTEEGLEQEFNSLDAQREAAGAFVRSQAGQGWALLPQRYDDGGFTGGNMDRPALQRLLADIQAGQIDCVVVYKLDRLSRSLLDFARLMEAFKKRNVSFVSVTQQFNTATSMGRLVINVMLSFAQFEREIIAERTRDKVAATYRKGKWAGGRPLLGFGIDPLRCGPCGCAMTPAHAAKGGRRYRYYTCVAAQKRGWNTCPSKSVPAAEIEALVVGQVREIGRGPALLRGALAQARQQGEGRAAELEAEGRALEHDLTRWQGELRLLSGQLCPGEDNGPLVASLAELQERVALIAGRVHKVRAQIRAVQEGLLDESRAATALALFDPLWPGLLPGEQARVLGLLVRRVDYDGARGKVAITFHPTGIKALADELASREEGRSA